MTLHFSTGVMVKTAIRLLLVALMGAALSGCAQKLVCSTRPTFFPPPPDDPHIQYLTGITNSKDVGDRTAQGSFSLIVTGRETEEVIHKIGKAYGIVAHKGKLYVAESATARVVIIDPNAGTFDYPRGMATPKGALSEPINLAFDDDDFMYVADTGKRMVMVYNPAGDFVRNFSFGPDSKIVSVALYNGKLYCLDLGTSRIRVLNRKTGEELSVFGYSDQPNQSLRAPGNFVIDKDGIIYVTNIGNNKLMKFDIDGNFIQSIGGSGDQPGQFSRPKGVAIDDAKRIYVVDAGLNVVHLFDDKGRLLTFFGWPGLETGSLNMPAGVAVTSDNLDYFQKFAVPGFKLESLIFVVNQFGQNMCIPRISVYGVGEMKKD